MLYLCLFKQCVLFSENILKLSSDGFTLSLPMQTYNTCEVKFLSNLW